MGKAKSEKGFLGGLMSKIRLILMLLAGGGAGLGGWQLSEHPIIGKLIGLAQQDLGDGESVRDALQQQVSALLVSSSTKDPGVFEVKLNKVELDGVGLPSGKALSLLTRVVRRSNDGGSDLLIWTSKPYGERIVVPGQSELTASWSDQPFEVEWQPGDRLGIEVWNLKGLRPRKLFSVDADTTDEFPFKSGRVSSGGNTIVIKSRRLRDLDSDEDGGSGPDTSVATRPRPRG